MKVNNKLIKNYKENLNEVIKYKSIAADSSFKTEFSKTIDALANLFKSSDFEVKILKGKTTNPYVFAQFNVSKKKQTVLIYGHYDVMPSGDEEKWITKPFELTEKAGRLYGRGSVDNKGQFLIHMTAISELIKQNKLNYNVKFLIEGNEETGNVEIADLIRRNKKLFACDFVVISDGEMHENLPTVEAGFRGGGNVKIIFTTAKDAVHSGLYGGSIPNPAHELSILISKFYDKNNKVAIPGFYEGVDKLIKEEIKNNRALKLSLSKLKELTGIQAFKTEKGIDYFTQVGLRPMLTVSGFNSGYVGEGFNNIVPSSAEVRVNLRYVSSQKPKIIIRNLVKFIKTNTPRYVKCDIEFDNHFEAVKLNVKSKLVKDIKNLLKKIYKRNVIFVYVGGSIPVVNFLKDSLGVEILSIPLGNEDANAHGANENFRVDLVEKGLEFSLKMFGK